MKFNRPSPTCTYIVTSSGLAVSQWLHFSFYPAGTKAHYCKVSLALAMFYDDQALLSQVCRCQRFPHCLVCKTRTDQRPFHFWQHQKKGSLSTLINCRSKGSLCLQLSSSLRKEMRGGTVGMSFSPGKSSWASLAHSYSWADLEPKQVKIALIFFEAEINGPWCKTEQKEGRTLLVLVAGQSWGSRRWSREGCGFPLCCVGQGMESQSWANSLHGALDLEVFSIENKS